MRVQIALACCFELFAATNCAHARSVLLAWAALPDGFQMPKPDFSSMRSAVVVQSDLLTESTKTAVTKLIASAELLGQAVVHAGSLYAMTALIYFVQTI